MLTKIQKAVIDYVACDLAMISESEEEVNAGTEFFGDYRPRAKALETLLALYFDDDDESGLKFNNLSHCSHIGDVIDLLQK